MEIGQKLKESRIKAGLKQEELARQLGVSRQTVSNWENNRSYPDIGSVLKLSDLYGLTVDELLKEDAGMRRHVEESGEAFRRLVGTLAEAAILLLILAWPVNHFGAHTIALGMAAVSFPMYFLSLFLEVRLLELDWKTAALQAVSWAMIAIAQVLFRFYGNYVSVLYLAGIFLSFYVSYRLAAGGYHRKRTRRLRGFVLAACILVPLFIMTDRADARGSFNAANPFGSNYYKVSEVLYQKEEAPLPIVYLGSTTFVQIGPSRQTMEPLEGSFTHVPLPEDSSMRGIWEMVPEGSGDGFYRITAEEDGSLTISCTKQDQLQWKYALVPSDTMVVSWTDKIGISAGRAGWYYANTFDPSLETGSGGFSVYGAAKFALTLENAGGTELTVYEEYHNGEQTQSYIHNLDPNKQGEYRFEAAVRQEGQGQWSCFRIPYEEGEFVFAVRYRS